MYCHICGGVNPEGAKFCCHCGKEQQKVKNSGNSDGISISSNSVRGLSAHLTTSTPPQGLNKAHSGEKKVLTFTEYKKRKCESRSSFLSKSKKSVDEKHVIQIGLMKYDGKTKKLKPARGRLALEISASASSSVILNAAIEKYSAFERSFVKDCEYALLYPDGSEVVNVPGTSDPFVLSQYRKASGKSYSRITMFMATRKDVLFDSLPKAEDFTSDTDSDDSFLNEGACRYGNSSTSCFINTSFDNNKETCFIDLSKDSFNHSTNTSAIMNNPTFDESSKQGLTFPAQIDNGLASTPSFDDFSKPDINLQAEADDGLASAATSSAIQCPICFLPFSVKDIAEHADICNSWLLDDTSHKKDTVLSNIESSVKDVFELSLLSEKQAHKSPEEIKSVLKESIKLMNNNILKQDRVRINVRRKFLWIDFKQARLTKIKPDDNLKVVFIGECAIDDGGPKREFFTELLEAGKRKLMSRGFPNDSTMALMANDFRLLGEAMVMSVIQGGPAPNFLNESIFQYIAKQDLSAENCQNEAFKSAAIKLSSCITDDVLHETILADEILDVLQNVGYTGVPQKESIKSSKDIVQSICIKDQISNSVAQLQQLQEGLSNCNLLDAIRKQPHVWKAVFVPSDIFKFTADEFLDHLQPQYSSSQALKMKEVDTFKFFNDVIQKFEDGLQNLTMTDFLQWCSGSKEVPPLGFLNKFNVAFIHGCKDCCKCRPSTSTCDLLVKLPVHIASECEMEELMVSAIGDSCDFGLI